MAKPIISVEGLGKRYFLKHRSSRTMREYRKFSDVILDAAKAPLNALRGRKTPGSHRDETEEFWALKDVSFEVNEGDVLGIIGRNGAGKSTLLKILSRITEPTEGRVTLHGRVASLLEVGTGFHPELSGRENIFLNGAILGMTRAEIRGKFDEIVDFAGVEKFLDTPVKRYSSGMYVRLAFAVAAHLEPEILIVDEILAVGDAEFQKKCLGKMGEVASNGRTVLFVSHNLGAIATLCRTAMFLQEGKSVFCGDLHEALKKYTTSTKSVRERFKEISLTEEITLTKFEIDRETIRQSCPLGYEIILESTRDETLNGLSMIFTNQDNVRVGIVDFRGKFKKLQVGPDLPLRLKGAVEIPNLVEGEITVGLYLENGSTCENFLDLQQLGVVAGYQTDFTPYPPSARGIVDLTAGNITQP